MNRQHVARLLTRAGLVLWTVALLLLVAVLVPSARPIIAHPIGDAIAFALSWAFLLLTPVLAVSAWGLSERGSRTRRLAIAQTLLWVLAIMMTLAIGF